MFRTQYFSDETECRKYPATTRGGLYSIPAQGIQKLVPYIDTNKGKMRWSQWRGMLSSNACNKPDGHLISMSPNAQSFIFSDHIEHPRGPLDITSVILQNLATHICRKEQRVHHWSRVM